MEGEQGSLKALISPCFVKEFPWLLCRIYAGIYTCDHCVACSGFPSAQEEPSHPNAHSGGGIQCLGMTHAAAVWHIYSSPDVKLNTCF